MTWDENDSNDKEEDMKKLPELRVPDCCEMKNQQKNTMRNNNNNENRTSQEDYFIQPYLEENVGSIILPIKNIKLSKGWKNFFNNALQPTINNTNIIQSLRKKRQEGLLPKQNALIGNQFLQEHGLFRI